MTGADAPQPLDRQRVQEGQLPVGRHDQQAVGLRHPAGHLGEELRPRDPDRDRQADALEHGAPQPHGDLHRLARDPPHAADVEERLVDRQPLDQRRGVLEDREHGPARVGVGRHPRPHHDRLRAQPARLRARPSPCGRRAPSPRSWPRARRRRRRSPGARAAADRRAARPTRRRRRGRRAGSSLRLTRTYVRIWSGRWQAVSTSRRRLNRRSPLLTCPFPATSSFLASPDRPRKRCGPPR